MICNNEFYKLLLYLYQYKINDFDNIDEIKKLEYVYFECLRKNNQSEKHYFTPFLI